MKIVIKRKCYSDRRKDIERPICGGCQFYVMCKWGND